ncbi:amino acid ABC transporter substrate-binding protein [Ponticoccus alexandrii]|uniref:Transporter substrate-binding domain-containing protein n=1 Tax=Ponticoccus alexandrii TaxID=1943633 RepID=A0ABX7FDM0_9RHOB|nr:amino acid ABC transporter substrate-binding protein [Ponticoccus alexandrii]ETA50606.1 amino acid ABC transporter substrate-binding protein [Rhodobacteraceae bacterium PD-2]QRF68676.1 transporter substrate-binding domain-containing protein [Ponticoccus alexandrii]
MTNIFKSLSYGALIGVATLATTAQADSGDTLASVKSRGEVLCGVHPARHGFAAPDSQGNWAGLEVDYCRAIAAAIFGDADKVRFVALSSQQRFPAIQSGEVDVLVRNVTATLGRDTALGLNFAPPVFYTGTGFLVHAGSGVETVEDLDGATICVAPGSTTERNVAQIFASRGMEYTPVVIENNKQLVDAYVTGRCDALTKDKAALPGVRAYDTTDPEEHVLLPGIFSKEPLAPAVRQGDDQWYDIVKWVVYATFNAEELGVTSENAEEMRSSDDVDVMSLLGTTGDYGSKLGLTEDWAYDVITQVGNYAEIYDRHFGPDSPVQLDRDLNTQWTDGGLLYGFPIK